MILIFTNNKIYLFFSFYEKVILNAGQMLTSPYFFFKLNFRSKIKKFLTTMKMRKKFKSLQYFSDLILHYFKHLPGTPPQPSGYL